jgi:hypothetical protein
MAVMDERTRLHGLVVRAGFWVRAIERLSNAAAENQIYDAHMCALALDHLKRCIDSIMRRYPGLAPEAKKLFKVFSDACKKANIKDLRDALEHEEDRFSGDRLGKRRQNKIYQGEDAGAPAIAWALRTNQLRSIYVLGVSYEIGEAADAAIALRDILLELAERTGSWKTMPT